MTHLHAAMVTLIAMPLASASAVPPDFLQEVFTTGQLSPVGVTVISDGRVFFWNQDGLVYTQLPEDDSAEMILDISDEVVRQGDLGLMGLAPAPDFLETGHLYLLYTVDWEYWATGGKPDPERMDLKQDTFGRLARFTCTWDEGFENIECGEQVILIGSQHDNGIPMLSTSHGPGTLAFAEDGTLLASAGDGACFKSWEGVPDIGGVRSGICSDNTGEDKGILRPSEHVGAYRAQLVDSYSGKILRMDVGNIDPERGVAGVPSNPFYDPDDPYAPRSKVWTLGLRNPFRFTIRPGSGSADPADGDPGTVYLGNVGGVRWEEFEIVRGPGENFGWPVFEGMVKNGNHSSYDVANIDAPNPLFDGKTCTQEHFFFTDLIVQESLNEPSFPNPCDEKVQIDPSLSFMHRRPSLSYRLSDVTWVPSFDKSGEPIFWNIEDPESPVDGEAFDGRAPVGGAFYTGDKWPPAYRGAYFFADAYGLSRGKGWIRTMTIDEDEERPVAVGRFRDPDNTLTPTTLAFDPAGYNLYVMSYAPGHIRRISYDCNGNGERDECDIRTGESEDTNGNGIPDECECSGDIDESGEVDFSDLLGVLAAWGPCDGDCPEDLDLSGTVDFDDLLLVLAAWGPCK